MLLTLERSVQQASEKLINVFCDKIQNIPNASWHRELTSIQAVSKHDLISVARKGSKILETNKIYLHIDRNRKISSVHKREHYNIRETVHVKAMWMNRCVRVCNPPRLVTCEEFRNVHYTDNGIEGSIFFPQFFLNIHLDSTLK